MDTLGDRFARDLLEVNSHWAASLPPDRRTWYRRGMTRAQFVEVLKQRCWNERYLMEAFASLVKKMPDTDLKLKLASQAADEAKHYRLLAERLLEMGEDPDDFEPPQPWVEFFEKTVQTLDPLEAIAAVHFTAEMVSMNVHLPDAQTTVYYDDPKTLALYRDYIQPDEERHEELCQLAMRRLVTTDEQYDRAMQASALMRQVLEETLRLFNERVYGPLGTRPETNTC
ncbi:MAG: ferritin-like domain-containing protein [Chloroflexi bacterium]|nr:ferritin-like domain-containing protein [Chloroflexota bacterium]